MKLTLCRCRNGATSPRSSRKFSRRRERQPPRRGGSGMLRRPPQLQLQSTLVPNRRQRAVSAAVVAPPPHRCSRDGHCSCSRCSGRRDGDWWKSCHSTSTSPTRREATRTRRSSLPPDVCTDAHARTHILHPTALWRRLLRRLLLHRSSPPRRPRSSLPRRSGRCLPATAPTRRMRTRPLDRCIDPAAVCSAAMSKWLRMPAMLTALRRKTRGACMPPSARPLDETAREPELCRTSSRA